MTHIITSLCLRDSGCVDVCPVECIEVHPDHRENPEQLQRKYEGLMSRKTG